MEYTNCRYYKTRRGCIGGCSLQEIFCQVELEQSNFCPMDLEEEKWLLWVQGLIDAEEVITT